LQNKNTVLAGLPFSRFRSREKKSRNLVAS
jgi:hypothetical protein